MSPKDATTLLIPYCLIPPFCSYLNTAIFWEPCCRGKGHQLFWPISSWRSFCSWCRFGYCEQQLHHQFPHLTTPPTNRISGNGIPLLVSPAEKILKLKMIGFATRFPPRSYRRFKLFWKSARPNQPIVSTPRSRPSPGVSRISSSSLIGNPSSMVTVFMTF